MREVGLTFPVDRVSAQDIAALQEGIAPSAQRVGAQGVLTDEADGLKTGADEVGVEHQVCKAQVVRHPEDLIERLEPLVAAAADGSLRAMGVRCEQAAADLPRVARTGQEPATRASQ